MRIGDLLHENVGRVRSRVGGAMLGSHTIFRGRNLHAELGGLDWLELYLFGITGRHFPPQQIRLLHACFTYTSYPDARIWNNRVAALAGTARSPGSLGMAAALAVSDAGIYGGGTMSRAIDFFKRTRARLDQGGDLDAWIRKERETNRILAGYGRPITHEDERIRPLMALALSLDLAGGPHLALAFEVERRLIAIKPQLRLNYGGLVAAVCADAGLSPKEFHLFIFPIFLAGMAPCYLEASERPEGSLLPLPCDGVAYVGAPKRKWTKP